MNTTPHPLTTDVINSARLDVTPTSATNMLYHVTGEGVPGDPFTTALINALDHADGYSATKLQTQFPEVGAAYWLTRYDPEGIEFLKRTARKEHPSPSMYDHEMSLHWDGEYPTYRLTCNAGPTAPCRTKWSCDCETILEFGVDDDGNPTHIFFHNDGEEGIHVGEWTDHCSITDWAQETLEENISGTVTVPVYPEWVGHGYMFHIEPGGVER